MLGTRDAECLKSSGYFAYSFEVILSPLLHIQQLYMSKAVEQGCTYIQQSNTNGARTRTNVSTEIWLDLVWAVVASGLS